MCGTETYFMEQHLHRYWYKIQYSDVHGNLSEFSNEVVGQYPTDVPGALPTQLRLHPNAPNPFNPMTTIRFDLPSAGRVALAVYDVAGRLIRVLVAEELPAGSHQTVWDGRDSAGRAVASGGYFARLETGGKFQTVRLTLIQ